MLTGLPEAITDAIEDIARTPKLLVALDFDGTLAPTVDDPELARATPAARSAVLGLLAVPATRVALVSGRAIASLARATDLPDAVLLVGSHGSEFRLDGQSSAPSLSAEERASLEELSAALDAIAARFGTVRIEGKPAGFALHTRLATPEEAGRAQAEASRIAEDPAIFSRGGKDVLEFSVRPADKGSALQRLRDYTGADRILFVGDDVTDEDAFAALEPGDVGVKVGAGDTAAEFRIESPASVAALLDLLAKARMRAGFSVP
jgi:trehalose 6-phosphate phosphatase